MRKRVLWFLMPLAAALLFSGVVLVSSSVSVLLHKTGRLPTQTPVITPTSKPMPTRTSTSTPTSTPSSTNTLTLSAQPPGGTVTPTHTLTPEPSTGPPPRIQRYVSVITARGERLSQALQALGELLQTPQLNERSWKREVAAQAAIIRLVHQELTEMEVPVEMIGVHSALLDATFDCDEGMFFLNDVDNIRLPDVRIASRLMRSCSEKFFRRTQTLEDYMAQFE